jgi:hypothetical protein
MDELVRWLGEQLDEDERIARAAADGDSGEWFVGDKWNVYRAEDETPQDDVETNALVVYGNVKPQSEHIAVHDPARVLREIEAKRRVVALWTEADRETQEDQRYAESHETSPEGFPAGREDALTDVLRLLALAYAARPGYREEWRP